MNHHKKDVWLTRALWWFVICSTPGLGEQMSGMGRPASSFTHIAKSCTPPGLEITFLRSIWKLVCEEGRRMSIITVVSE